MGWQCLENPVWPAPFLEERAEGTEAPQGGSPAPEPPGATYWRADTQHFPPAIRHKLVDSEARFTTSDTYSHLLSFGEFAATYLCSWSNVLWDLNLLEDFNDIIGAMNIPLTNGTPGPLEDLFPTWGTLFRERNEKGKAEIPEPWLREFLEFFFGLLSAEERCQALKMEQYGNKKGHLAGDPPQPHPPLTPDDLTPARRGSMPCRRRSGRASTRFKKIYDYAIGILGAGPLDETREKLTKFQRFMGMTQEAFGGLYKKEFSPDRRREQVEKVYNTLPKVRRALANVPTYMMFDDHDVTDDWYPDPMWRDRVLTSPLGRTIVRNGILAYALFQGWGNDPARFQSEDFAKLLHEAVHLFPAEPSRPTQESPAAREIDRLLGLDGSDPPLIWHYAVQGGQHMVLALDNRTRRSFVSRVGPPGNIALHAMTEQILPGPLPSGIDVLIVMAPLPVLGPPVFDEIIAPFVYRAFDVIGYIDHNRDIRSGMAGDGIVAEELPSNVVTSDGKGFSPMAIIAVLTKVVRAQEEKITLLYGFAMTIVHQRIASL
ncbi:MAG: hypothetical protein ACRERE_08505 [Candidatus Entotheonellia bacterium]